MGGATSAFVQLLYGHDRDHVTKRIEVYCAHVTPVWRARTQSLDYLSN